MRISGITLLFRWSKAGNVHITIEALPLTPNSNMLSYGACHSDCVNDEFRRLENRKLLVKDNRIQEDRPLLLLIGERGNGLAACILGKIMSIILPRNMDSIALRQRLALKMMMPIERIKICK